MKELVIVDSNYIAYRSFFGSRGLGAEAVDFGYAKLIQQLYEHNSESVVCWCFDVGGSKRAESVREYKQARRKELPPEEAQVLSEVKESIDRFRTRILPSMGFENIYGLRGYEADDLIASLAANYPNEWKRIVSSDQDLYQLLDQRTSMQPVGKPVFTLNDFVRKYDISPTLWAKVKAVAGCTSDGIPGVKGIGEKTAIKFLCNKASDKQVGIIKASFDDVKQYYKLTKLPYKGTPSVTVSDWSPIFNLRTSINDELKRLHIYEVKL